MTQSEHSQTDSSDTIPTPALEVDARGLRCPLPILRAKKALSQLESGQVLKVLTTDINAIRDFQAFCRQSKNPLLKQEQSDNEVSHYLRRR